MPKIALSGSYITVMLLIVSAIDLQGPSVYLFLIFFIFSSFIQSLSHYGVQ